MGQRDALQVGRILTRKTRREITLLGQLPAQRAPDRRPQHGRVAKRQFIRGRRMHTSAKKQDASRTPNSLTNDIQDVAGTRDRPGHSAEHTAAL